MLLNVTARIKILMMGRVLQIRMTTVAAPFQGLQIQLHYRLVGTYQPIANLE